MENLLEKLFDSVPRARLLRLFLRNPEGFFTFKELVKRAQMGPAAVRKEIAKLMKIGVIRRKIAFLRYEIKKKSRSRKKPPKIIVKTKKEKVFYANPEFPLTQELRELVTRASVASRGKLLRQIKGLGNVKLAVLSGIFINNDSSRTDLLVVGDKVGQKKLNRFLSSIESELGAALRYTLMDTKEFKYRLDMYDRFLRDILEYPHEKLINKLRI